MKQGNKNRFKEMEDLRLKLRQQGKEKISEEKTLRLSERLDELVFETMKNSD